MKKHMVLYGYIFFFVLGAAVGSFLNVLSIRYGSGTGIGGRSRCMHCGRELSVKNLIPIVSFLFQRGRCTYCKSSLALQYPLVEIITAVLFALLFWKLGWPETLWGLSELLFGFIFMSLLVAIGVYDLRHKIIPDGLVYLFDGLALLSVFVTSAGLVFPPSWISLVAGPAVSIPFALLWVFSKGRWMGLGDAKLALGMGWILGLSGGFSALLWAFWIGGAWSVCIIVFRLMLSSQRRLYSSTVHLTMKSEVPFAPFLILGFLLVFLFGFDIIRHLMMF